MRFVIGRRMMVAGPILALTGGLGLLLQHRIGTRDDAEVAATTQVNIQSQLDSEFSPGVAKVMSTQLIGTDGGFTGSARLLVIDKSLTLPFSASHDGNTTVVTLSSGDLDRIRSSFQNTLSDLVGKPPVYILDRRWRAILPTKSARAIDEFRQDLAVGEVITGDERYYIADGCRAHHCMTHRAAWIIDKDTAHMILVTADFDLGMVGKQNYKLNFNVYGQPGKRTDVPQPLQDWENNFSDWLNSAINDGYMVSALRGAEGAGDDD